MKRFGLIGCPISHSLSPALFRAAYGEKYGSHYTYDLIEGDDFMESYGTFTASYDGINVTAPFKEKAFVMADTAGKECKAIGAANLLVKTASGITACNTDCMGVRASLEKAEKPGSSGRIRQGTAEALIVGCGGAGKAAAAAAAEMGMKTTILNRTVAKAEEFAAGFPGCRFNARPLDEFPAYFRESDVIIYTLPSGIPQLDSLTAGNFGADGKTILEANYRNPCFPDILRRIFPRGCSGHTYIPGQQWLLYQAIAGYILFTGEKPDETAMMKVL